MTEFIYKSGRDVDICFLYAVVLVCAELVFHTLLSKADNDVHYFLFIFAV